jgi:hypothetical protein
MGYLVVGGLILTLAVFVLPIVLVFLPTRTLERLEKKFGKGKRDSR